MALHNKLGKEAEEMAVDYLVKNGYEILHCNWRYSRYEIDIIAKKNDLLKIVEVKSLRSSVIRYPEQGVTKKKFKDLLKAADQFLFRHQQYRQVQFDVLSIIVSSHRPPEFFLIEDVFL
jgi:putative endonuclease